jgi:ribonuclease G
MNKEMIISSGDYETRVAILEDDQVVEVFIEREKQRGVVGNVYKGRVNKVLPGMQSSFIDIGLERDAFLYVSEVVNTVEEFERLAGDDEDEPAVALGIPPPEAGVAPGETAEEVAQVAAAAAVAEPAAAPASATDARPERRGRERGGPGAKDDSARAASRDDRDRPQAKIEDLLKEGQDILVQVVKEPLGTKGARLTSHVTMPGRFLVFMPTVDHVGVSRKIDSREERGRLRGIVREFREQHGFTGGVIIRTAAGGRSKEDIVSDLSYFHQVWTEIRQKMEARRAPALLFQEQSLVTKLLRDLLTDDYTAIRLDDPQEYRRVVALVERIMPNLLPRVKLYTKDYPILEEYGVQAEIDKALRPKVWLKSGGYLVINQTEALVAIDVNTGRYVGKRTGRLEDTIVKTNLEAVKEIVRQLRLRDLGGIIVLDLIDMEEKKNRQKVFQEVDKELRKDRSPSKAI